MKSGDASVRSAAISYSVAVLDRQFAGGRRSKLARFLGAAGGSVGLKLASAGMTFLTTILVARSLSASGVGVFALVTLSATIGSIVVAAGFEALALKLGARDSARATQRRLWRIMTSFIAVFPLSGLVATVIIAGLLAACGFEWRAMLAPVALQTLMLGVYRVIGCSIQARGETVLSQVGLLFIRPAVILAATYLATERFGLTEGDLLWIMMAGAGACLTYALVVFSLTSVQGIKFRIPRRKLIAGLAARAPSYAGFFAVVLLIEQIDILMLGIMRGEAEAGLYQPASRVAWIASLGGVAIAIIGRAEFAKAAAQNDVGRIVRLMNVYRAASMLYVLASGLFLFLFSDRIFHLFGKEYQDAGGIVLTILVLHAIAGVIGPVDTAAQVLGSGESILGRSLVSLAVFIAAGLLLIPGMGAHGAALAAVIGGVLYRISFLIFVRKRLSDMRTLAAGKGAS